jgi:ribonuclease HI
MINSVAIYTDGSCDTQSGQGAWVAIILKDKEKVVLSGTVADTTHNRMELSAVIEGIRYAQKNHQGIQSLHIYSDSQYVTGLMGRRDKLTNANFITSKGTMLRNTDMVKELYILAEQVQLIFTKVIAHQKQGVDINYNIDADKLVRKIMREELRKKGC